MPPWKPVPDHGDFAGSRRLGAAEIHQLVMWAEHGAPAGDLARAPQSPRFDSGWQLGTPDAVLSLPHPTFSRADRNDEYRCFVIATTFKTTRWVKTFEFSPNGSGALHHALIFIDSRVDHRLSPDYECFGTPGFLPSGAIGGWTPGTRAVSTPPGTATRVPANARIVIQLHIHPTGKAEAIDPKLALYFSKTPPTRVQMDVGLGSNRIDIAPGEAEYKVRDSFELPVAVEVTGIIPHAHYICRDMKAWAVLPNGRKRWLIWIKDWDFNWQEQYRYSAPFTLPEGTRIEMEYTYDNSDTNIRNPSHPPKRVVWGAATTDEMASLHVEVMPFDEEGMHELGQALWGRMMRSVGGEFFRRPAKAE